mgnify:CR=1 FL=1
MDVTTVQDIKLLLQSYLPLQSSIKTVFSLLDDYKIEYNRYAKNVTIEVLKGTITNKSVEILITDNNENYFLWGINFLWLEVIWHRKMLIVA